MRLSSKRLSSACPECGWRTWKIPIFRETHFGVRCALTVIETLLGFHYFGGKHATWEWSKEVRHAGR